jgi:phage terminase large subunit-like protein
MGELEFSNGAKGKCFSAEEPDRLNGPQHYAAWCDEMGVWKYPKQTWDMLMMGLRMGAAKAIVTTTPKRQYPKSRELIKLIRSRPSTRLTVGSSGENRANLSDAWWNEIVAPYEGTELGRQEIGAEVLDDISGAMWHRGLLDQYRVTGAPHLTRIVVAVDPEAMATETSAETGIIVAGLGIDHHGYVLADRTIKGSPHAWGSQVVAAYHAHNADRVIYETNQGGDMVANTIHSVEQAIPLKGVHASRGKQARAEPISTLYEKGMVHHVGVFTELEDQLCNWTPNSGAASPDRLDALVWALSELMLTPHTVVTVGGRRIT